MHVYWLTLDPMRESSPMKTIRLNPKVPDSICGGEDPVTPRICCAMSIRDCLVSLEAAYGIVDKENVLYNVYEADVPVESIYQPSVDEVPDVWFTNELWIVESQQFNLVGTFRFRKQMRIDNSAYSRYSFHRVGVPEVIDRIFASNVYGDDPMSFSFIEGDYLIYRQNFATSAIKSPPE